MQFLTRIRTCSAALLNQLMRQDPEATKAAQAEEAQAARMPKVFHPAAAKFLENRGGPNPLCFPEGGDPGELRYDPWD